MAPEQSFSNDLRSAAVDYNRDHEQKHKWALGGHHGPGRTGEQPRPFRYASGMNAAFKRDNAKSVNRAAKLRKQEILPSEPYTSSDSSADEEPVEASAAPEPDAEITYSFDAERGPSQGSQILNQALVQAIERFEDRKTHELVEEEYEVLDENGEAAQVKARRSAKGKKKASKSDDDDDFVVV